jgi:hypothetical protein
MVSYIASSDERAKPFDRPHGTPGEVFAAFLKLG